MSSQPALGLGVPFRRRDLFAGRQNKAGVGAQRDTDALRGVLAHLLTEPRGKKKKTLPSVDINAAISGESSSFGPGSESRLFPQSCKAPQPRCPQSI